MIFNSSCLLSKWGNDDGDMLDELLYDYCEKNDIEWEIVDSHKLLRILIEKYVLPKITPAVEIEFINTIHNPVRAKTINGKDCTHLWYKYFHVREGILSPEEIEIPEKMIISEFKTMMEKVVESPEKKEEET